MTKAYGETLVHKYTAFFLTTVLRPFFVYGVAQHPQMLIPRLLRSVQDGQPIRLAGPQASALIPFIILILLRWWSGVWHCSSRARSMLLAARFSPCAKLARLLAT